MALVTLSITLAASLVFAPGAMANFLTLKSGGSPNADGIASLYKIILYLAAIVFVGVEGALLYSVIRFRSKRSKVAAQIHGNTRLEIGWTVGAALILVAITDRHLHQASGHHQPTQLQRSGASRSRPRSDSPPRPTAGG